ncbi:hypothetical protein ABIB07_003929 [Bradyrhizobium sp. RT10b]
MLVWIAIVASLAILIGAFVLWFRHITRDVDAEY